MNPLCCVNHQDWGLRKQIITIRQLWREKNKEKKIQKEVTIQIQDFNQTNVIRLNWVDPPIRKIGTNDACLVEDYEGEKRNGWLFFDFWMSSFMPRTG